MGKHHSSVAYSDAKRDRDTNAHFLADSCAGIRKPNRFTGEFTWNFALAGIYLRVPDNEPESRQVNQ